MRDPAAKAARPVAGSPHTLEPMQSVEGDFARASDVIPVSDAEVVLDRLSKAVLTMTAFV
jgi:hypothetical protein